MHGAVEKAAGKTSLPAYLLEKENRVKQYRNSASAAFENEMEIAIKNTKGWSAQLRLCQDTIEGSVLALGVPTSYALLKRMEEVQEGFQQLQGKWAKVFNSRREENRLHDALYEGSCGAYATMREKSEQLERELKTMIQDQDRRDEALDNAIQYVHTVIAERAAWQEKYGYNNLELPMEELTFSERCTNALSALYYARRVQMANDSEHPHHIALVENPDQQKVLIRRPAVSLADEPKLLAKRWREVEDTRQSMASFSCRLKYIPPMEEINLLRDVLAMGTGATTLKKDVENDRRQLRTAQWRVKQECTALHRALLQVKEELVVLKYFLRECREEKAPFLCQAAVVVKLMTQEVQLEALSMAKQWEMQREQDEDPRLGGMWSPKRGGRDSHPQLKAYAGNPSGNHPTSQPFSPSLLPSVFSVGKLDDSSFRSNAENLVVEKNVGDARDKNRVPNEKPLKSNNLTPPPPVNNSFISPSLPDASIPTDFEVDLPFHSDEWWKEKEGDKKETENGEPELTSQLVEVGTRNGGVVSLVLAQSLLSNSQKPVNTAKRRKK